MKIICNFAYQRQTSPDVPVRHAVSQFRQCLHRLSL